MSSRPGTLRRPPPGAPPPRRRRPRKILGVAVGFLGVLAMARPAGRELATANLEGVLYMVAGSLSVGASFGATGLIFAGVILLRRG